MSQVLKVSLSVLKNNMEKDLFGILATKIQIKEDGITISSAGPATQIAAEILTDYEIYQE